MGSTEPKQTWHDLAIAIPTFRRNESLRDVLRSIEAQGTHPGMALVIDNNPDGAAETVVREVAVNASFAIEYLAMGRNTGPAGAFAAAVDALSDNPRRPKWMMCRGDDNPFSAKDIVATLLIICRQAEGPSVAGVGIFGKLHGRRNHAVTDSDLSGLSRVDFIPGGGVPTYNLQLLAEHTLTFDSNLFFGHEELHLGLQIKRSGLILLAARLVSNTYLSAPLKSSLWRTYFDHRNRVIVAREFYRMNRVYKVAVALLYTSMGRALSGRSVRHALAAVAGLTDGLVRPSAPPRGRYIPR